VFIDGTLRVTEVTRADAGLYTCHARNVNGEAQNSTMVSITGGILLQHVHKHIVEFLQGLMSFYNFFILTNYTLQHFKC